MNRANDNMCELIDLCIKVNAGIPVDTLANLRHAGLYGSYHIIRDNVYHRIGYIAWASINKESYVSLRDRGLPPKYPGEWNEGRLILITDLVYRGVSHFELRGLIYRLFPRRRIIIFRRNNMMSIYRRDADRYRLVARHACSANSAGQ